MKKTLKIFSILLAACCSLLFLCLVGIRIYLDTSHARQLAQNIINRSIPGTISWTDHSLSLFKGKAVFTNILLKGPGGDLIVKTETLTCDIFLPDLIENILTFQNIILENPVVHLFIDKEGNVNIAGAFITQETPHEESPSRDQEDTPFNVLIRHALVKNGSFQYSSYTKEDILLSSLDLELKNGDLLKQRAQVILESSSGKISIPEILEIPQVQTKARASIDGNKVDVDKILITSGKNSLSVKGRCDVMSGNIKSTLSLIVDGAFFNTTIEDIEGLDGHYIADAAISGELTDPLFSAQLRGNGLSYQDIRFGDLAVNIDYSEGRFSIKRFTASQNQSKLSLSGSVQILDQATTILLEKPTCDISIHDSNIFLGDFNQDLKGKVAFSGAITGHITDPSFKFDMEGDNLSYQKNQIGGVAANILFDEGKVTIKQLNIVNKRSHLDLSGSLQVVNSKTNTILEKPSCDISIHGSKIFLGDFNQKIQGEIALSGAISGDTAHPVGNLIIKGNKIDTDLQMINEVTLELRIADNRVFIDHGRAEISAGEEVQANGWISFEGEYDLEVGSKGISFHNINQIDGKDWGEAKLNFNFSGAGSYKDPKLTGGIEIRGLAVKDKMVDPISLKIDVSNMTARISGKEPVNVNMEIQMETQDINGSAYFERIDLHPFFTLAGYEEIAGNLDGRIELAGNIGSIGTIQAQIKINELETFWKGNELLRAKDQILTLKNGFVSFADIRLSLLKEGFMDLKGGADINGMVDLTANARVPTTIIEPFLEEVYDSEGYIDCNATIRGVFEEPEVRAEINFTKIGLNTPYLSERLRNTSGRIQLTQNKITIENITGNFDTGKINIDGSIDFKDFKFFDSKINIYGHAVPIHIPDEMDIILNTELTLKGKEDKYQASGEIIILEGAYFRDVDLNLLSLVPRRSRSKEPGAAEADREFLKNISFDIAIGYRNPFIVENNLSLLEIKPDLRIKGTPDHLIMSGRASVEPGGTIKFQEKEFEVTRGIIDFLNPYRIEPTIDLESKTTVREWTIFLNVSGTPDNLSFTLRSDPPEQNNDILYLLAFGKTLRESSSGTKSTSPEQMLASIMAEKLQKSLKDNTGLDSLELEYTSDSSNGNGSDEVRVTLGKDLSRRFSVKFGVETSDRQIVQRTTSEYKFTENFLMDAYNDTKGDYGAGLRYRLEFR